MLTGIEDKQECSNILIEEDCEIKIDDMTVNAIKVPCHTRGHTLYQVRDKSTDS